MDRPRVILARAASRSAPREAPCAGNSPRAGPSAR